MNQIPAAREAKFLPVSAGMFMYFQLSYLLAIILVTFRFITCHDAVREK